MASPASRYTRIAILFHWSIAIGLLAMVAMGLAMMHAPITPYWKFTLFQWHKSVGITVLLLAPLRLAWRVLHRPPRLPAAMPRWERGAAEGTHVALYGLMIGLPLVGWALVSASPLNIPTYLYGHVFWPHLPLFADAAAKRAAEPVLAVVHAWGAYALIALVLLHGGAALRHHLVIGDDVLARMIPGLRRPAHLPGE